MAESFGNLQSSSVTKKTASKDHPGRKQQVTDWETSCWQVCWKSYANESKIPISASKQREARREIREKTANRTAVKPMQQPLQLGEPQRALKKLKPRKSPGLDGITNEMLIHLGSAVVCKLLQIYNHSWEQGVLPQIWQEETMIPILKKRKGSKEGKQLAWPAAWWRPWKELWMSA